MQDFTDIRWLFFDVGSTLVDESECYRYRLQKAAGDENGAAAAGLRSVLADPRRRRKGGLDARQSWGA